MECPHSGLLCTHGIDVANINKAVINIQFLTTGVLIFLGFHIEVRLLRKLDRQIYWKLPISCPKKFTFPSAVHIV